MVSGFLRDRQRGRLRRRKRGRPGEAGAPPTDNPDTENGMSTTTIRQSGHGNVARVTHSGEDLTLDIRQEGPGHVAEHTQTGRGKTTTIVQKTPPETPEKA